MKQDGGCFGSSLPNAMLCIFYNKVNLLFEKLGLFVPLFIFLLHLTSVVALFPFVIGRVLFADIGDFASSHL